MAESKASTINYHQSFISEPALSTWYSSLAPWLLAALIGLLPMLPLLQVGFFRSDDGLFHLYRIDALTSLFEQGYLYPRWFPTFGFGYGQPVLNFYSPLIYYVGVAFAMLGFESVAATKLTIATFHLIAALGMFAYARLLWRSQWAGLTACAAYSFAQYHLADAFMRGALAEHAAFAWFPLILLTTYLLFQSPSPRLALPALVVSWAGLVLTHHLSALMFAPVGVIYTLALAVRSKQIRPVFVAALAGTVALACTAFYWLPTLQEAHFVGLGDTSVMDGYRNHLTSPLTLLQTVRGSGENGEARDFGLETLPVLLSLAALLALRKLRQGKLEALLFTITWLAAAALLTTVSLPLWQAGEPLLFRLQYPWRWLSMVVLGQAVVIGVLPLWVAQRSLPPRWLTGLSVATALGVTGMLAVSVRPLPITDSNLTQRMWNEDAKNGQIGATWTGEFVPVTVQEQRWAIGRPPEARTSTPRPQTAPDVSLGSQGANINRLRITNPQPVAVRFHTFYFPGWQVRVDGQAIETQASGALGLATAIIPAGTHDVAFVLRSTPVQRTAMFISVGGILALLLIGLWVMAGYLDRQIAFVLAAGLFAITLSLIQPAEVQPRVLAANIDNQTLLLGYQPKQVGRTLRITLYWWALRNIDQDYSVFVHLMGSDGAVVAQHDSQPVGGYTPTSRWQTGELIIDEHDIPLPDHLASGVYQLKAGMYQAQPVQNLPVLQPTSAASDGDQVPLGAVNVQ